MSSLLELWGCRRIELLFLCSLCQSHSLWSALPSVSFQVSRADLSKAPKQISIFCGHWAAHSNLCSAITCRVLWAVPRRLQGRLWRTIWLQKTRRPTSSEAKCSASHELVESSCLNSQEWRSCWATYRGYTLFRSLNTKNQDGLSQELRPMDLEESRPKAASWSHSHWRNAESKRHQADGSEGSCWSPSFICDFARRHCPHAGGDPPQQNCLKARTLQNLQWHWSACSYYTASGILALSCVLVLQWLFWLA